MLAIMNYCKNEKKYVICDLLYVICDLLTITLSVLAYIYFVFVFVFLRESGFWFINLICFFVFCLINFCLYLYYFPPCAFFCFTFFLFVLEIYTNFTYWHSLIFIETRYLKSGIFLLFTALLYLRFSWLVCSLSSFFRISLIFLYPRTVM